MNLNEAWSLARSLMDGQGLNQWSLEVTDKMNKVLGRCYPSQKRIVLNRKYVLTESEESVRDTILHEIAHALTHGYHDQTWKSMARKLGANPSAKNMTPLYRPRFRFTTTCPDCGKTWYRVKRPRFGGIGYRCPYDTAGLTWVKA